MKNTKKRLRLSIETVRHLDARELARIDGGIATEATSCTPTQIVTCHLKTPGCPM